MLATAQEFRDPACSLSSLTRGQHLVSRQVEVLLVVDDLPQLRHAEGLRLPRQLARVWPQQRVVTCTC